jgi:hypothetical protein
MPMIVRFVPISERLNCEAKVNKHFGSGGIVLGNFLCDARWIIDCGEVRVGIRDPRETTENIQGTDGAGLNRVAKKQAGSQEVIRY